MEAGTKVKVSIREITLIGVMVAVIEVCKVAIGFLPNIELTSFWVIMFTLFFGKRIMLVVPVFILVEGLMYGMGLWWIMYLYVWPLLALVTWLCRRQHSVLFWSIVSGGFGLLFGLMCTIPYIVIGTVDGGWRNGLFAGFSWWIAGIPWDMIHCVSNFVLMLVLYKPVRNVMQRVGKLTET